MSRRYEEEDVETLEAEAYKAGIDSCASYWEEERGEYEAKIAELEEEIERLKVELKYAGKLADAFFEHLTKED